MAYSVDTYSGSRTFVVEDGTINSSLDIALIGKNYAGYGESLNENFVHLLENFAGTVPPTRPVNGQIWYDAAARKLKVWDAAIGIWRITGSTEVSPTPPQGLSPGALWWDETNKQLYVYDGTNFVLVGPQSISSFGTTEIKSVTVTDNSVPPKSKTVLVAYVANEIMYVVSKDEFTLSSDSAIALGMIGETSAGVAAFSLIKAGLTLVNTPGNDGVTTTDRRFHGTASSAMGLVDDLENLLTHEDFLRSTIDLYDFTDPLKTAKFGDNGYLVGNGEDLQVKIENDNNVLFRNKVGQVIKFQTRSSSQDNTPLVLNEMHVLPGLDNVTDLGSTSLRFRQVRALDFYGNTFTGGTFTGGTFTGAFVGDASGLTGLLAENIAGTIPTSSITGTLNATAERANLLYVAGEDSYVTASIAEPGYPFINETTGLPTNAYPLTVAVRDQDGHLNAIQFKGTATTALFADLAEKYLTDQEYEIGTVVTIGGEAEVTACQEGDLALGAVSANPAFMMNSMLEGGTYIALKGRVLIKVEGAVNKGNRLVAANNGAARVINSVALKSDTFAIALETNDNPDVKLVECVIL